MNLKELLEADSVARWFCSKTERSTRASGSITRQFVKAKEFKSGLMVRCTKDIGQTTRPMERVVSFMQMVMFMMDTGKTIKPMVRASTVTSMVHNTEVSGRRISSMVTVLRPGPMALATRVSMLRERSTERVASHGPMVALTRANSLRITLKVMVSAFLSWTF